MGGTALSTQLGFMGAIACAGIRADLPKISCPTLVTCAPTDGPFADLEYVARLVPGAIAKPHPHRAKMDAASDTEIAALAKMLCDWLDGGSVDS